MQSTNNHLQRSPPVGWAEKMKDIRLSLKRERVTVQVEVMPVERYGEDISLHNILLLKHPQRSPPVGWAEKMKDIRLSLKRERVTVQVEVMPVERYGEDISLHNILLLKHPQRPPPIGWAEHMREIRMMKHQQQPPPAGWSEHMRDNQKGDGERNQTHVKKETKPSCDPQRTEIQKKRARQSGIREYARRMSWIIHLTNNPDFLLEYMNTLDTGSVIRKYTK